MLRCSMIMMAILFTVKMEGDRDLYYHLTQQYIHLASLTILTLFDNISKSQLNAAQRGVGIKTDPAYYDKGAR